MGSKLPFTGSGGAHKSTHIAGYQAEAHILQDSFHFAIDHNGVAKVNSVNLSTNTLSIRLSCVDWRSGSRRHIYVSVVVKLWWGQVHWRV